MITDAHPQVFLGGRGPDPEAIYNLLDFKKLCYKIML
jgi:hypothetical protein